MIRVYEFDTPEEAIAYFGSKEGRWLTARELNDYLVSTGHRPIKTPAGRKSYCERNGIEVKKKGREYYYQIHANL